MRKQPRRRTFLPEPESASERAAKVGMAEAGNGTGALYVLMDAIRDACICAVFCLLDFILSCRFCSKKYGRAELIQGVMITRLMDCIVQNCYGLVNCSTS